MKHPVRYSRGRVQYTGRIDWAQFVAWAGSQPARAILEQEASGIRFALLGATRTARRRVWREVLQAARSGRIAAALQHEIDAYLPRLETLAFARDLPRVGVDLHRLIAVPRVLPNAAMNCRLDVVLDAEAAFASRDRRQALRDWFILMLIEGVETAIVAARPSPRCALSAGESWMVVGVNERFEWRVAFNGPTWPGHYYLLERTRMPITRRIRKAADEAIARMESSLASLSPLHRTEILGQASSSLQSLPVHA